MTRWVRHGRWHVLAGGAATECGVSFVAVPRVVEAEDEALPPDPCRACLLTRAMRDVEDEPLAEARARGYEEAEPLG